jgi:hypothetical protein
MRCARFVVLSAATTVAALGISGCAGGDRSPLSAPRAPEPPALAAPPADAGPLPAPEALADVVYRLADTAVPGADKLTLVHNTAPADIAALDAFGTALRDNGFTPITVTATDVRWSDTRPEHVLSTITITTADQDDPGEFAFPMEFQPAAGGWRLTRETADLLLVFGSARSEPVVTASPQPVPGR